jgi:iron(III) transport system substrate-binding protein
MIAALAACSAPTETGTTPGTTTDDPELAALIAAAQKEGEVTWYQVDPPSVVEEIAKAFNAKYGIKTNWTRLTTAKQQTRYSAEAEAGAVQADLIVASNGAFMEDAATKGWLIPVKGEVPGFPFEGFNEKFLHDDFGTPTLNVPLKIIAYNTDKLSEADAPKDWPDLLDPKYKDQIILVDPASSDSYPQFWTVIEDEYGADLPQQIADQVKQLSGEGGVPMVQQLAAGEAMIAIPPIAEDVVSISEKGAPVGYIIPPVTTGSEHVLGLSANAPHPNAARLLAHFLLSDEAAPYLAEAPGVMSAYEGIGAPAPAGYVPSDPIRGAENAERFYQIFGSEGQ